MTDSAKHFRYRLGFLVLVTTAVYAGTLGHGFIWDDSFVIVDNPLLRHLSSIPKLFFSEDAVFGSTGYYRPVTYLSFALDRAAWGLNPAGFHASNLLLHLVTVALLYAATAEISGNERLAFVASLLFSLHPVAGETVNFLSGGRNTLLSACFSLLTLLLHVKGRKTAAAVAFTIAVFSKEFALLLPLALFAHDCRKESGRKGAITCLPYLAVAVCYLVLRSFAVRQANFLSLVNWRDVLASPEILMRYLLNTAFPFRLKILYDIHPQPFVSAACVVALAAVAAALWVLRKNFGIVSGTCWFFLFLLPVANIIPLESASLMADRYAYFSLMGFAVALATVISSARPATAMASVIVICGIYSATDVARNPIWKDEVRFFNRMVEDAPGKFDGCQNLGMYYYRKGDIADALPLLAAAAAKPGVPASFLIGSASVFWKEGLLRQAEQALLGALRLEPSNPEPYLMLITLYEREGEEGLAASYRNEAENLFRRRVDALMAKRIQGLCREGEGYVARGLYAPAENVFWQALAADPGYPPALAGMGMLNVGKGNPAEALIWFRKASNLSPSNPLLHYDLAKVCRMLGLTAEAEKELVAAGKAEAGGLPKDHPVK